MGEFITDPIDVNQSIQGLSIKESEGISDADVDPEFQLLAECCLIVGFDYLTELVLEQRMGKNSGASVALFLKQLVVVASLVVNPFDGFSNRFTHLSHSR